MDIHKDGWFGQLVSPNGDTNAYTGSLQAIITESVLAIRSMRATGDVEILLRVRNRAFDTSKESAAMLGKAVALEDMLDSSQVDKPLDNETYDEFYARLIDNGYNNLSAVMVSAAWFNRENDPEIANWLGDPKAIRFRELNSRAEAFEAALPSEYETLKHYVIQEYPTFVEHLTFRTA